MINRDPRCIFVGNSLGEADVVANWLAGQGIRAEVMNQQTLGGLDGLTPFSPLAIGAVGIEVWVTDPATADEARSILSEMQAAKVADTLKGPVNVTCEECGKASTFPAHQRGSVQDCPHCGSYLDVVSESEL